MNFKDYLENIKSVLEDENIKYDEKELENVVTYAVKIHDNKKILDENTIDFVLEVAKEVATLRLDDKSIYAALLYPIVDYEKFEKDDVIDIVGQETVDLKNLKRIIKKKIR